MNVSPNYDNIPDEDDDFEAQSIDIDADFYDKDFDEVDFDGTIEDDSDEDAAELFGY